jgi:hypothetical protein
MTGNPLTKTKEHRIGRQAKFLFVEIKEGLVRPTAID